MIVFAWEQFPQYAARAIGAYVKIAQEKVVVVATKPKAPVMGMEALVGCPVCWLSGHKDTRSIVEVVGEMPRAIFTTGWSVSVFNRYRDEVRGAGGQAFAMVDNNYQLGLSGWINFKEFLKMLRFRLFYRGKYDGYLVPGKSGMRLMRYYGVPAERISIGFYSADASLFPDGRPMEFRDKKIVFVGQFIKRKNVIRLCRAFIGAVRVFAKQSEGWTLELYGYGVQEEKLRAIASQSASAGRIVINGFLQPEKVGEIYRNSKVFVLPSLEEHWGLVVHEAAMSGCVMLLSRGIGAAEDFVSDTNGITFDPRDEKDMIDAIGKVMSISVDLQNDARAESVALGARISLSTFVEGVAYMLKQDLSYDE
jgi:glycosyltransferase involved in cell wall biosynthesis